MKMSKLKNELRLFVNQLVPLSFFLIGVVFALSYIFLNYCRIGSFSEYISIYIVFSSSRQYAYIFFPIVGVVSLMYFSVEKDQKVDELLYQYIIKQRKIRVRIFLCFIFIYSLGILCVVLIFCLIKVNPLLPRRYLGCLALQILYDYFLTGVLAVLFSYFISFFNNRSIRLVLFILVQFIMGYPLVLLSNLLLIKNSHNTIVNRVADLFAVLPDGFQYGLSDSFSVAYIQPHHVVLFLSWFFVLKAAIACVEKKKIRFAMYIIACGLFVFLTYLPWTAIYPGYRRSDDMSWIFQSPIYGVDLVNFDDLKNYKTVTVTDYDIKLNAYMYPKFKVIMTFDDRYSGQLAFTLQKGFKVTSVKDDYGNDLKYIRKGNYLIISADSEIDKVVINYYGEEGAAVSDISAIFLKPGTVFFPFPGVVKVYDKSEYHNLNYWEVNRLEDLAHFRVEVNTIGEVISSLPNESYNVFDGYADSFFILKGMYDVIEINGMRVIYPYAAEDVLSALDSDATLKYMDFFENEINSCEHLNTILVGFINSINTREIEVYYDFVCINTFYDVDNRREDIEEYILLEEIIYD